MHSESADVVRWLRTPGPSDDKYTRGVLGVRTGSSRYPGAAVLGVAAAWRTGLGMVRYVPGEDHGAAGVAGLISPAAAVLTARPETVFGEGRADAWLVGSGTDPAERGFAEREALGRLLRGPSPVVVDAGALGLAVEVAVSGEAGPIILTPHRGEFERLWGAARLGPLPEGWPQGRGEASAGVLSDAAVRFARELGIAVLLKGSTTVSAAPEGDPLVVGPASPWLATAGTGDVLAGMLGALVAAHAQAVQGDPALLHDLGAAAARLHDDAARIASGDPGRPVTALDVADAIPEAVAAAAGTGQR